MRETPPRAPAVEAPASDRVSLARIALDGALKVEGVVAPYAPPTGRQSTLSGGVRVDGVTVIAGPGAVYDVRLHLVARAVPLPALAERIRDRVEGGARRAGLAERLGTIGVRFEDLAEPPDAVTPPSGTPSPGAERPPAPFPGAGSP